MLILAVGVKAKITAKVILKSFVYTNTLQSLASLGWELKLALNFWT